MTKSYPSFTVKCRFGLWYILNISVAELVLCWFHTFGIGVRISPHIPPTDELIL